MAETKTEQEPSIEEILESIRQIISDDGDAAPADQAAADASAPAPQEPAPVPVDLTPEPEPEIASADDEVIDLTERVDTPAPNIALEETEEEPPAAPPQEEIMTKENEDALISTVTADAATAAMAKLLSNNVAVEKGDGLPGKVTLEDIARELMKPLIKSWLDQNLPRVIEKMVAKEIERLSRRAIDE